MEKAEIQELRYKYSVERKEKEHELCVELLTCMAVEETFTAIYDKSVERFAEVKAITEKLLTVPGIPMELIREARMVLRSSAVAHAHTAGKNRR